MVVFLIGILPKEYLHDVIFTHKDDVHPIYKKGELVFYKRHNHCTFVDYFLAHYIYSNRLFYIFKKYTQNIDYKTTYIVYPYYKTPKIVTLRGPPSFI